MILLTNQNYFGHLKGPGARFMPDLFSPYFSPMQTNIFRIYRQMKTALIFPRAIVNSQPSSHVCAGSFNSVTGLLIYFFANEWRSIGDGDPNLQVGRLEYMMLHNLEEGLLQFIFLSK
jgi:hypothetical protein